MDTGSYRGVLANHRFAALFSAQTISLVGSGMTTVALGILAYDLAGGNAAAVLGTALTLRIIAYVLFSPIAGVIADRIDRKRLLLGMDALRFGIIALMPWVTAVWQVYLLIFLLNLASAFHTPTYQSVIPDVVPGDRVYLNALSLSRVAYDLQNLASPALAAAMVAWLGYRMVFYVDAASFALSFLIVLFISIPSASRAKVPKAWRDLPRDTLYGARILLRNSATRFLLFLNLAVALAGAAAIVDTVVYLKDVLHQPASMLGIALAAIGVGSLLTSYLIPALTQKFGRRQIMLGGGLLLVLALLPGALKPALPFFMLLWFINGAGQALISVPGGVFLKEISSSEDRARIYAAYFSLSHAAWLIGYPLAGWLGTGIGIPWTLTVLGICTSLIVSAAMLVWKESSARADAT